MTNCPHAHKIGDNLGTSCYDCGKQLYGYGYWGLSPTCMHLWSRNADSDYEICMFCEQERKREPEKDDAK